MLKLKLALTALLLSAPLLSYADSCTLEAGGYKKDDQTFFGPTSCSRTTQEDLSVDGPLSLKDSNIQNVNANGPVTIQDSNIVNLTVKGILKLTNTKVDKLDLKGPLEASRSDIANIDVYGVLKLTDSTIGTITMNSSALNDGKIYLKGNSIVKGNIDFKGGQGIVYQDRTSQIMGTLTNGRVEINNP